MTKIQKILLWSGLALFAIPEILWSPVGNAVYGLLNSKVFGPLAFRPGFITDSENLEILFFLVFIQSIGLFLFATTIVINAGGSVSKWITGGICYILSIFVLMLSMVLVSLRSIGF